MQRLQHVRGFDVLECYTADPADLNDGSGRSDKREVLLPVHLKAAARRLNPGIPDAVVDAALAQLADRRQAMSLVAANREVDGLLRDGIPVTFEDALGKRQQEQLRLIDFSTPGVRNNEFLAVSQLWVKCTGTTALADYRRPDVLLPVCERHSAGVCGAEKLQRQAEDRLQRQPDELQTRCSAPVYYERFLCFVQCSRFVQRAVLRATGSVHAGPARRRGASCTRGFDRGRAGDIRLAVLEQLQ